MKTWMIMIGLAPLAACGDKAAPGDAGGAKLELTVAPLELAGVTEAVYTLEVYNADDELVWDENGLESTQFGDGRGALTYVGPCDADSSPASVKLVLESLWAGGVALVDGVDYRNPAPGPDGVTRLEIPCVENADTPVTFDLTILRSADQGFFDIAVEFQDVFCSAKLDCQDELLLYPEGHPGYPGRGPTAVIGFACTGGEDDQATWLYLGPVRVVCGAAPDEVAYTLYPDGQAGNQGPLPPVAWQTAIYHGKEAFQNIDKCYWNFSLGLDPAAIASAGPCRVELSGTASGTRFEGRRSPDAIYPVITWSVPLDGEGGSLCGENPLNGEGSGVQTDYTDFSGAYFPYELDCESGEIAPPPSFACASSIGEDAVSVAVVEADALVVKVGGASSAPYRLPAGFELAQTGGDSCCVDPCCDAPPPESVSR